LVLNPVCGTLGGIACGVISDTSLKEIRNNALEGCNITSFLCGDSVTSIGAGAFLGCMNLTTVELNKTYLIGNNAFRNCPLNSITINSANNEFD
jgi:GH24 family phage-related lysozyme (muramidase)